MKFGYRKIKKNATATVGGDFRTDLQPSTTSGAGTVTNTPFGVLVGQRLDPDGTLVFEFRETSSQFKSKCRMYDYFNVTITVYLRYSRVNSMVYSFFRRLTNWHRFTIQSRRSFRFRIN